MVKVTVRHQHQSVDLDVKSTGSISDYIAKLCAEFTLAPDPKLWTLYIPEKALHLTDDKLKLINDLVTKGEQLELKEDPIIACDKILEALRTDAQNNKMLLYKLSKTHLSDPIFTTSWIDKGGLQVLGDVLKVTSSASQKSLVLRALALAMTTGNSLGKQPTAQQISLDLVSLVLDCCQAESLQLAKAALQVTESICGANLYTKELAEEESFSMLISQLGRDEIESKVYALKAINALLKASEDPEALTHMDELGLLDALIAHCLEIQVESMRSALLVQQKLRLRHLIAMKDIPFDTENEEHAQMLKDLWSNLYPEKPFEGPVGEQWKDMGFQGKNPVTDLRGVGMLGLHMTCFYAKHCSKEFRANCDALMGRDIEEPYYPVATACINITQLLLDVMMCGNEMRVCTFDGDVALEQSFCGTMKLVHREFLRLRATYMQFTSILMPAVKAHLEQALSLEPVTVGKLCELLDSDKEDLVPKASKSSSSGGSSKTDDDLAADLPIPRSYAKQTLVYCREMALEFVRTAKLKNLQQGVFLRAVVDGGKGVATLNPQFIFLRLDASGTELESGQTAGKVVPSQLPDRLPLSSYTDIAFSNDCAMFKKGGCKFPDNFGDRCFNLFGASGQLSPTYCCGSVKDFQELINGFKVLFKQPLVFRDAINDEVMTLTEAEIVKRRLHLEDVIGEAGIPTNAPPIPELPAVQDPTL